MRDSRDRTALVTGSTSGIGKATALALAARGAHVLVAGRDEHRAEQVVAGIEGGGSSAAFRLTTLGDLESARELVEWATEAGDGHVDILVDNAGVASCGPTKAWAAEYGGRGVRVNAVAPGPTHTPTSEAAPEVMVKQH